MAEPASKVLADKTNVPDVASATACGTTDKPTETAKAPGAGIKKKKKIVAVISDGKENPENAEAGSKVTTDGGAAAEAVDKPTSGPAVSIKKKKKIVAKILEDEEGSPAADADAQTDGGKVGEGDDGAADALVNMSKATKPAAAKKPGVVLPKSTAGG